MAATGTIMAPLDLFADNLAASSTFQTFLGVANATLAKATIDNWEFRAVESGNRCLVQHVGVRVDGVPSDPMASGTLRALLERDSTRTEFENSFEATTETFFNQLGAIDSEMRAARLANPHLYPDLRGGLEIEVEPPEPRDDEDVSNVARYVWRGLLEYQWEGLP